MCGSNLAGAMAVAGKTRQRAGSGGGPGAYDMKQKLDLRIDGARCLCGKKLVRVTVGVRAGVIVYVGRGTPPARGVVAARGLVLAPGFVDVHTHGELYNLRGRRALAKIAQGVTTEIIGNCGLGVFPFRSAAAAQDYLLAYAGVFGDGKAAWRDYSGYGRAVAGRTPVNLAALSAYGPLRLAAAGNAVRPLTAREFRALEKLLRAELAAGTLGLSLGLCYPPCSYADDGELRRVFRIVAEYPGRVVAVHGWNEGDGTVASVQRVLALARGLNLQLELSHLKAYGRANWHKYPALVKLVEQARRTGMRVGFDCYPYGAGSTTANTLLPAWALRGGVQAFCRRLRDPRVVARVRNDLATADSTWENFVRVIGADRIHLTNLSRHRRYEGKSISAIARALGTDAAGAVCRVVADERGRAAMLMHGMDMQRVAWLCRRTRALPGSDGLYGKGMHPRAFGTMPEFFRLVTSGQKRLTAGSALWKMTTQPAEFFGLPDRGRLAVGAAADLVLLDLPRYRARATYARPQRVPAGVKAVWVNGQLAYDGKRVRALAGRMIRCGEK